MSDALELYDGYVGHWKFQKLTQAAKSSKSLLKTIRNHSIRIFEFKNIQLARLIEWSG
jgi:hypothetical protein